MIWKVLLVDDDEGDRLCFRRVLQAQEINADLRVAADGREALDLLAPVLAGDARAGPHLILLDLNMAGMDGFELLRILKSTPATRSIPAVVLTTSSSAKDIEACYALGANSYIVKPASLVGLVHCVRALKQYWADIVATTDRAA